MLQTRERVYILCAKSEEDRNMWMSGFRYIISSTVTVQQIMRQNDVKVEARIKKKTDAIREKSLKKATVVTKTSYEESKK